MSTIKVSDLTQLVTPATNDELLITDVSASQSKKITVSGLLNAYTETDPIVGAVNGLVKADGAGSISAATVGTDYLTDSSTNTLTNKSGNISQWTNDSGYLTSFTESDPVFSASDAAGISSTDITNWNTAYGWGNHASAGYLTSFSETNDLTVSVTWANVPDVNITQSSVTQHQAALSITESQISDLGTYLEDGFSITAGTLTTANITTADFGNWTITETSGELLFATGGSNKMKLDTSGNLVIL